MEFVLSSEQVDKILEGNFVAKIQKLINEIKPTDTLRLVEKLRYTTKIIHDYPGELFFILDISKSGTPQNNFLENTAELLPDLVKERTLIYIDYDLNIISKEKMPDEEDSDDLAKKISKDKKSLVILITPPELTVYCCDKLIEYLENSKLDFISKRPRNFTTKSMDQYPDLLKEHYETEVKYAQVCDHWSKKTERILRNKPESMFRKNLWNFFRLRVSPLNSCDPEYELPSGDKVDIRVLTGENDKYLIEIKCLGKCRKITGAGVTETGEDWALHGARQTIGYLDLVPDAKKGICVIYDGRNKEDGSYSEIVWREDETHPQLDHFQFYLESKSASARASS